MNFSKKDNTKSKKNSYQTYLSYFACLSVFAISIISAFTVFIDPYFIFNTRRIKNINKWKSASQMTTRSSKPLRFILYKPKKIILGSSTAEVGIDPSYKNWENGKGYNFSFGGGTLSEAKSVFEFAIKYGIEEVILITDFIRFFPEQDENNLNIMTIHNNAINHFANSKFLLNWLNVIFSPKVIRDSLVTLILNNTNNELARSRHFIKSNGSRDPFYQLSVVSKNGGYKYAFKRGLNRLQIYSANLCDFDQFSYESRLPGFIYFSNILELAHENKVNLRIVIPPMHATAHLSLIKSNKYSLYQKWKEMLLKENLRIATRFKNTSFPLYDFGLINKYSMEEIPFNQDTKKMVWFTDAFHFSKVYGDKIMDFIFMDNLESINHFGYKVNLNLIKLNSNSNLDILKNLNSKKNNFSMILDELKTNNIDKCTNYEK